MKLHSALLLAALLTATTAPAMAQVHRCTDADGKVSFSDTLCNGQRAHKTFGSNATSRAWTVVEPSRPSNAAAAATLPAQVAQVAQVAVRATRPAAPAPR